MSAANPQSPRRRKYLSRAEIIATGGATTFYLPVPCDGTIDSIRLQQVTAGSAGTSWTVALAAALRRRKGVSDVQLFSTAPVVTLAAGAMAAVESSKRKDAIATPSGCTKPVMASAAATRVKKGDVLSFNFTTTGAYSPFPICAIDVAILPTY